MIVKVIGCCFFIVSGFTSAQARSFINDSDTSFKSTSAAMPAGSNTVVVLKKANVVYPAILNGNEAQSIGYIEKFSAARKEYLVRTFNRSKKLFPKAVNILKKYNIPEEFRVLLALESGFNANAVSPAGAVGYWQIMDEVAKEYGMKIAVKSPVKLKKGKGKKETVSIVSANHPKKSKKAVVADDRKNFIKSTHVAARYLRDRCRNLNNDWLLITASYNCGVGNVWNAMERSGKKSPTFWDIKNYLPAETRAYVMNFIALNVIFKNYEAFSKNDLCFRDITTTCNASETGEENCDEETAAIATNDY